LEEGIMKNYAKLLLVAIACLMLLLNMQFGFTQEAKNDPQKDMLTSKDLDVKARR
jgi:hypothetical protein